MRATWGLILLISSVFLLPQVTRPDSITIATVEYTSNWNPIAFETYPALLATRFTTERLFEKKCAGSECPAF